MPPFARCVLSAVFCLAACAETADDDGDGGTAGMGATGTEAGDDAGPDDGPDDGPGDDDDGPQDDGPDDDAPDDDDGSTGDEGTGSEDDADTGESDDGALPPPPGLPCDSTFEHAGRQGCQSVVDGLDVKFFPFDEPAVAQRLIVYLHGDGGNGWTNNWGFDQAILDWAAPQDFLVVGIRAPSSYDGDPDPAFGAAQPEHADMVATTLETFVEAYDVVEQTQLYWGVSGGSWFTTSSYIPVAGHRVPGVFVANCGGSGISFGWQWDPASDPATVALNQLYFNYGDQDFLAEPSAESLVEYTNLGFVTDELVHPGARHCAHPIPGPTIEFWTAALETGV